jgi:hypothetical protein
MNAPFLGAVRCKHFRRKIMTCSAIIRISDASGFTLRWTLDGQRCFEKAYKIYFNLSLTSSSASSLISFFSYQLTASILISLITSFQISSSKNILLDLLSKNKNVIIY